MHEVPDSAVGACLAHFQRAEVSFVSRKEFYYGWSVRSGGIDLRIGDYLEGAPDPVLPDFCDMVCRRASGRSWRHPRSFLEFVTSDGFIVSRRPMYIARSRNLARSDSGDHARLSDSVQRLLDSGLLSELDIRNSYISWTRRDSVRRVGFCSTMFRVVGISARLDSDDVPDMVLDYVVYHECLHLRQGYRPSGQVHDREFRSWERSYPGWRECESFLKRLRPLPPLI